MEELLIKKESGGFLELILNRSSKRNALNQELRKLLLDELKNVKDQFDMIVISGKGPCFCAGLDLKEDINENAIREFQDIIRLVKENNAFTVSYIDGTVWGGGLILARACTHLIATKSSSFGMPTLSNIKNPIIKKALIEFSSSHTGFTSLVNSPAPANIQEAKTYGLVDRVTSLCYEAEIKIIKESSFKS